MSRRTEPSAGGSAGGSPRSEDPGRGPRLRSGDRGEDLACALLVRAGARVLGRNWRARPSIDGVRGELDLIVELDGVLVGVEVKTRASTAFGHPLESIDAAKRHRLHLLLAAWARREGRNGMPRRIDAVAVLPAASPSASPSGRSTHGGRVRLEHRRGLD